MSTIAEPGVPSLMTPATQFTLTCRHTDGNS